MIRWKKRKNYKFWAANDIRVNSCTWGIHEDPMDAYEVVGMLCADSHNHTSDWLDKNSYLTSLEYET